MKYLSSVQFYIVHNAYILVPFPKVIRSQTPINNKYCSCILESGFELLRVWLVSNHYLLLNRVDFIGYKVGFLVQYLCKYAVQYRNLGFPGLVFPLFDLDRVNHSTRHSVAGQVLKSQWQQEFVGVVGKISNQLPLRIIGKITSEGQFF